MIYYSLCTGNTEKIAGAIGNALKDAGWESVFFEVNNTFDPENNGINFLSYNFICVGSPVFWHMPYDPLLWGYVMPYP